MTKLTITTTTKAMTTTLKIRTTTTTMMTKLTITTTTTELTMVTRPRRTTQTHVQVVPDGVRGDGQECLAGPDVAETACSQVDVV